VSALGQQVSTKRLVDPVMSVHARPMSIDEFEDAQLTYASAQLEDLKAEYVFMIILKFCVLIM